MIMDEATRKQQEVEFHNQRERDRQALQPAEFERKYSNKKWYSVVRKSRAYVADWMKRSCHGKVALDYCCGLGATSLQLAQNGAFVHGIDISNESVETARKRLQEAGFGDQSSFQVMDAERLTFEDNFFDVIVCTGVLHHLDINRAYRELARVLKPTGKILCIEALGHNPAIALYRKLSPNLRTAWETDHILKMREIRLAGTLFGGVELQYFHLFSIAGVLLRNTPLFSAGLSVLEALDSLLLQVPYVNRMAWQIVFELSRPQKSSQLS